MSGTLIEIALGTIAGIVGGIAVASTTKEHGRALWVDVFAGGAGGLLGTIFLRDQVLLIVNLGGGVQASDPVAQTVLLVLAAAGEGAIVALVAAMMMMWLSEHKSK